MFELYRADTNWIDNRERKLLCIYCQSLVLNSICGYKKEIWKCTRNTTVPVLFVSVVYSNFSAWTTHWIHNRKRNYYASIANHQYLIRYIIKVDIKRIFRKVQGIQRYRFYLFPSCIRILAQEQPIGSITEKDNYYASIANHQYLIRYVIKVDIQRRFGKVKGIQRYRFTLFLSCMWRITNKNGCNTDLGRRDPFGRSRYITT